MTDGHPTGADANPDRYTELPAPDRFFLGIEPAEVEMRVMDREKDDVRFEMQVVPGGQFAVELCANYEYAGRECNQHVTLDREAAEALYDALGDALEADDNA